MLQIMTTAPSYPNNPKTDIGFLSPTCQNKCFPWNGITSFTTRNSSPSLQPYKLGVTTLRAVHTQLKYGPITRTLNISGPLNLSIIAKPDGASSFPVSDSPFPTTQAP